MGDGDPYYMNEQKQFINNLNANNNNFYKKYIIRLTWIYRWGDNYFN